MTNHFIYRMWSNMMRRCNNTNDEKYPRYGGRGIKVCAKWFDVCKFIEWAELNKIKNGLQIDRIDNNGNYEPSNCRFVTLTENCQNTSRSKRWFINGIEYLSSAEAAKALGVCYQTIHNWCNGYTSRGVFYPPKQGCHSCAIY